MRFGLQLTLDGMTRALRTRLHDMSEQPDVLMRRAERRNDMALTLLAAEARRSALEASDELGR